MDVFELQEKLVSDYQAYTTSFVQINDKRIRDYVATKLAEGLLWPEALTQLNPAFEPGAWIDQPVDSDGLSPQCRTIFRVKRGDDPVGKPLRLHKHQEDAIHAARTRENYS